jgi:polysaccharide export outer membrane protein
MLLRPIFCVVLATLLPIGRLLADGKSAGSLEASDVSAASQSDYLLKPFDLVQIVVFQEPDLERKVRLSEESALALPLIGTVNLTGKTVRQAEALIRDLYNKDYLVDAQINVTVLDYTKVKVNVLGAVNTPGAVTIPPDQPLKLLDAVTQAGGFSRLADRKRVKLNRVSPAGKTVTTIINADDIIQSTTDDPWTLQKGDVIYVPERIL